jgi:hypothetical protein
VGREAEGARALPSAGLTHSCTGTPSEIDSSSSMTAEQMGELSSASRCVGAGGSGPLTSSASSKGAPSEAAGHGSRSPNLLVRLLLTSLYSGERLLGPPFCQLSAMSLNGRSSPISTMTVLSSLRQRDQIVDVCSSSVGRAVDRGHLELMLASPRRAAYFPNVPSLSHSHPPGRAARCLQSIREVGPSLYMIR